MKKKTTMFIALASVMLGVGYGAISQKDDSKNTDSILLENVEALASDESGGPHHCLGIGCVDCPINHTKVEVVYSGWSLLED
ncbi:NVEALA domain-containing protein [uncultured Mediterranea sp.]|uniref:NVEALA domain-containing protein n=1 Tax=uncultured Mediterranea sp. TaxID=1926662 RepID=UPI002804C635|nr:NVEALA domain-containing protein [uncultured Mediterranea sp.]